MDEVKELLVGHEGRQELLSKQRRDPARLGGPEFRWTTSELVSAIQEWNECFGSPPRCHEWSPSNARSLGLFNDNSRRWEQDYPRWPSAATVASRFGRWTVALKQAGFPVRACVVTSEGLAQRVDDAQRLRADGLKLAEIADLLEVSISAVNGYLRAGSCAKCGAVYVRSTTGLCKRCSAKSAKPVRNTEADFIELIQLWSEKAGRTPARNDWLDPPEWWADQAPWPAATTIVRHFGSWSNAIAGAGLELTPVGITREEVISELQTFYAANSRPPYTREYRRENHLPALETVIRLFGTHKAALSAAGVAWPPKKVAPPVPKVHRWTKAEVLDAIREWHINYGVWPRSADWHKAGREGKHPSSIVVYNRFGSWSKALHQAGGTPHRRGRRFTNTELLELLTAANEQVDATRLGSYLATRQHLPNRSTYIRRFGTWRNALKAAGID